MHVDLLFAFQAALLLHSVRSFSTNDMLGTKSCAQKAENGDRLDYLPCDHGTNRVSNGGKVQKLQPSET